MKDKKDKELIFYEAGVNAWFNTQIEKDKSMLTLSIAGIGLLITFPQEINGIISWFYFIALIAFIITVLSSIQIYKKNAKYIKDILINEPAKSIKVYDIVQECSFYMGLLFSVVFFVFGIYYKTDSVKNSNVVSKETTLNSLGDFKNINIQKEKEMEDKELIEKLIEEEGEISNESFDGCETLLPKEYSDNGNDIKEESNIDSDIKEESNIDSDIKKK